MVAVEVLSATALSRTYPADSMLVTSQHQVALKRISRRFTNTQGFKAETQALLRIYDNGGHPNISGLRGKHARF